MNIQIPLAVKTFRNQKIYCLQVLVHVELAVKIEHANGEGKNISLANKYGVSHLNVMPDQPSPDKRMIAVRIERGAYARLEKAAKRHKMNLADFLRYLIQKATEGIELTDKDHEKIAADIRAYRDRQARRGTIRKT